jgi:hypothetical protein
VTKELLKERYCLRVIHEVGNGRLEGVGKDGLVPLKDGVVILNGIKGTEKIDLFRVGLWEKERRQ